MEHKLKERFFNMEKFIMMGMSICITVIITSIFTMIVPDSKLEKVIGFSISLFFLVSIITPFINRDFRIDFKLDEIVFDSKDKFQSDVRNQFLDIACNNLENQLINILVKEELKPNDVKININIQEDNSISIIKAEVFIKEEDKEDAQRIKQLIFNKIGIEPLIVV